MAFTPDNLGHVAQTISSSAVAPSSIPAGATEIIITTDDNDIRARWDGTDPDTTTGILVTTTTPLTLKGRSALENLKLIAAASDAACEFGFV